ncbi:MAG: HNH endonuclease signature motif containing protein [Anaerolineae bacterium]|nr:HNH endonuclease signature motif containing protein [Anaerolineae bacterium]MDQ7036862.1 HNH endonuclease signature motif containing protein [Anaerolineae bacterium]
MAKVPDKIRDSVRKRADYYCEYCKRWEDMMGDIFEIDHIKSLVEGGSSDEENLCLACSRCNSSKSKSLTGIDRSTGNEELLFNPRTQKWSDHFRFSDDYGEIIGLTPTGRATVQRLKFNLDFISTMPLNELDYRFSIF